MYWVSIQYLVLGIDRKLIFLRYWSSTTGSGIDINYSKYRNDLNNTHGILWTPESSTLIIEVHSGVGSHSYGQRKTLSSVPKFQF